MAFLWFHMRFLHLMLTEWRQVSTQRTDLLPWIKRGKLLLAGFRTAKSVKKLQILANDETRGLLVFLSWQTVTSNNIEWIPIVQTCWRQGRDKHSAYALFFLILTLKIVNIDQCVCNKRQSKLLHLTAHLIKISTIWTLWNLIIQHSWLP